MKGKNKLVPRLLGVTKESILRVDEKTKEVGTDLYYYDKRLMLPIAVFQIHVIHLVKNFEGFKCWLLGNGQKDN